MSSSYKFYSDTKDIMKKYVNATEGAIIYGISKSRIMVLASEAGAVYKVGNSALINTDIFATVYKGNIIKNLIMDCQSYTKYRPNETTGGIFVSWRRKEELPTGA